MLTVLLLMALVLGGCDASGLRFEHAWVLALLPVAWGSVLWRWRTEDRLALWYSRTVDVRSVRTPLRAKLRHAPKVLRLLAIGTLIAAVARPQQARSDDRTVEGVDIFLVLDMSGSMAAVDMTGPEVRAWQIQQQSEPPNRFEQAVATLKRFVAGRTTDRIGMVVFAHDAYLQFPLTLDYATVQSLLDGLRLEMIDPSATAIGNALGVALRGLIDSDARSKAIVLITDGNQQGGNIAPMAAAELAADETVRIYTILVGAEGTSLMPTDRVIAGVGRQYREQPNPIDPELLQRVAERTGGAFYRASNGAELERDLNSILDELEKTRLIDIASVRPEERFGVVLLLTLALLLGEALLGWWLIRRFP